VVDAGFFEDFGAGFPAEFFVEGDGVELGVAVETGEGEFGEGADLDGDHEVGSDAFALALLVDAELLDFACGFVSVCLRWIERGGTDDGIASRVVDDGDEVFAQFFAAGGHVVVVIDRVADGLKEDGGAQGDFLLVQGVVHRDALDTDHCEKLRSVTECST